MDVAGLGVSNVVAVNVDVRIRFALDERTTVEAGGLISVIATVSPSE